MCIYIFSVLENRDRKIERAMYVRSNCSGRWVTEATAVLRVQWGSRENLVCFTFPIIQNARKTAQTIETVKLNGLPLCLSGIRRQKL